VLRTLPAQQRGAPQLVFGPGAASAGGILPRANIQYILYGDLAFLPIASRSTGAYVACAVFSTGQTFVSFCTGYRGF
jgi:hypothetical protein